MTEFLSNKVREANDRKGEPCAVKQSINKKNKTSSIIVYSKKNKSDSRLDSSLLHEYTIV